MTVFQGRDRAGTSVDFAADGDNAGLVVAVAAVPKVPTILGHEKLVVGTTAVSLQSIATGATHAMVTLEGADIRFREDGTNPVRDAATPTNDVGLLFISGNAAELSNLANLRFIRTGSATADGTLNVSYRKYV